MKRPCFPLLIALALAWPLPAAAQVFVYPRRPDKSLVRHFDFQWKHSDLIMDVDLDPEAPPGASAQVLVQTAAVAPGASSLPLSTPLSRLRGTGRVRLYFYEREREVAERASVLIQGAFTYLAGAFDFVPGERIPFVLYSSYQEFLQTNLFPLQEGVLGVTSPRDLKMTLPYFGDHRLFDEVGTHEMAHQFTIQKVRAIARAADLWGDPLENLPLWFIEGLAEYYAKRGIDPEAEMLVRDILVNPDFQRGFAMLDFFEDRPFSVLWTYKVGQVRCAFLEDHYGQGIIQKILDRTPSLVGPYQGKRQVDGFENLLKDLTGDSPRKVAALFSEWLKRRAYPSYLDSKVGAAELEPLETSLENINALASSPDGKLLLLRSIDSDTGRSRLTLLDVRAPDQARTVVADGVPGAESLHPVAGRNFDLRDDALIYVAEVRGRDRLYRRGLTHLAKERSATSTQPAEGRGAPLHAVGGWSSSLSLGPREVLPLPPSLLAVGSPAFSPDGRRVVFIALSEDGQKDLYVVDARGGKPARRITDDLWAEREVSWGISGIVYNADATEDGHYNLFQISPAGGRPTRLTFEKRDARDLKILADGRVIFVAYDHARADIYEATPDGVRALTALDTGLFDPSPAPDGALWALWHHGGQRVPVKLRAKALSPGALLSASGPGEARDALRPRVLESKPLIGATRYDALKPSNWELGNLFGLFGAGGSGVYGQLIASASDKLRNHALLLNLFIFGSFDLTDGFALYVNQSGRLTWGGGVFQRLLFRTDQTPGISDVGVNVTTAERFYGAMGSLRYPFDTYHYLQGDLSLGGTTYFLLQDAELFLGDGELNGTRRNLLSLWRDANGGARLQGEVTLRYGYDTIRYHRATGPLAGSSLMLESTTTVQPLGGELFGNLRVDAERYLQLWGRANVFLRGGLGTSYGSRFARQFYLSSFDTLRGVPFGDVDFLRGQHFAYGTLELQFPLNAIVRLILFTDIEGVLGVDFGAVGNELEGLWNKRVLDVVVGVNFGFGPLVFRLHFAKPVDTGANPLLSGVNRGLPNGGKWVTNFSLGWVYF